MTSEASWHHVKSQENPADCASREDVKCEEKSSTVLTNVSTSSQGSYLLEIIAKYSSFSRLIRVIAWCKRYIKNCRSSRATEETSSSQQQRASASRYFSGHRWNNQCWRKIKNSSLSPIQKHPILLPKSHHLTNLVIQHFHHINLHSGPQLTLCCIRQKFWIPSGREVVGRLLSKCQTCFRFKAKSGEQLMGNLPANRLSAGRAFLNVGIDFGGPFITKPNVSRSKVKLKSYLALFICMATKAVHLEVVSDLSADAFWQHSGASYPDEENQPTCFPTMQLTSKEPLHI
ncbi:uncharacterized protein TNCV_3283181 [Trichonephila clavipes]|nr:uncharacterized protein TNCV_3283181 [Trichonephila clavipes]